MSIIARVGLVTALLIGSTVAAPPADAASPAPAVTGLSVTSGPTAGGMKLVIHGRHFGKIEDVIFGYVKARHVHRLSSHRISVVVPRHEAGTYDVRVDSHRPGRLLAGYTRKTAADRFTYYRPPAVASLSPASGPLTGGRTVRVTGTDFRGVTAVTFGGVRATRVRTLSTHVLTATAPPHRLGSVDVQVRGRYGLSAPRSGDVFAYVAPPTVTSVQKATGPDVGGDVVSVAGTNFRAGATVRFGAAAATEVTVWSAELITARTPAHAIGSVAVTVVTSYGSATKSDGYRFDPASRVYAWGSDAKGDLGDGNLDDRTVPSEVLSLDQATSVLADPYAGGVELMPDGTVRQWGYGTLNYPSTPVTLAGLDSVTQIATSGGTHYALRSDGTVWAWGFDTYGQLGDGTTITTGCQCRATPAAVPDLDHVVRIDGGYGSVFAIRDDGTVWGWGKNQDGGLGVGSTDGVITTPTQLPGLAHVRSVLGGNSLGYAVDADGAVWSWGCCAAALGHPSSSSPAKIGGLAGIDHVAFGGAGRFAFATDGTVYTWGDDGLGGSHSSPTAVPALTGFTTIAGGGGANFGLKADGTVWAWGDNDFGQLGVGPASDTPVTTPTQLTALSGVTALSTAGYWTFAYEPPR